MKLYCEHIMLCIRAIDTTHFLKVLQTLLQEVMLFTIKIWHKKHLQKSKVFPEKKILSNFHYLFIHNVRAFLKIQPNDFVTRLFESFYVTMIA